MEIKQYLPIIEKMQFVETVVENSFTDSKFDNIDKEVYFDILLIQMYTDYKLDEKENIYKIYDRLSQDGVLSEVKGTIPNEELSFLMNSIDEKIRERQSLSYVVSDFLNKAINLIPSEKSIQKMIKSMGKEMKNISPENMELLKSVLGGQNVGVKKSGVK